MNDSRPLVILDAPARAAEIYGTAPARLGRPIIHPPDPDPDSVLALDPAAILLSSEWTHEWRLISAAARRADIPVVYVMDGVLEWSYVWNNLSFIRPWGTMLQPLLASDLCVIGRHPARILSAMGLGPRIHIVGLPRFDHLDRQRILTPGTRPRLLIATARTAGHDVEQQVLLRRALRDLKTWLDTQPHIEPIWRIAADLAEDIGTQPDVSGPLDQALTRASALISSTSTCILEAMHKGVPVAQLDYRPAPQYVATAWEIRCPEHIPTVIHELLYPPPQKLAWQDACYADELESGDATSALASTLADIIARPRSPQPAQSTPPTPTHRPDGRLDYRQIHSELSAFSLDHTPTLQYELAAAHHLLRHTRHLKGFLQRDAIEFAEAVTANDLSPLRAFSLIEHLPAASIEGSAKTYFVALPGARSARAIVTNSPARLTYAIPTGSEGQLSLALTLHPADWSNPALTPLRFLIQADDTLLLDATLDFRDNPDDRKWWWFTFPVPASQGAHQFQLAVEPLQPGPAPRAAWRSPYFLWQIPPDQPLAYPSFRPNFTAGCEFYVPGRTVA